MQNKKRSKFKKKIKILGIILARGGSKEIPRKNLLKLNGKTLVELAIKSAKKSKLLNKVVFSTEDKEIYRVAKKAGAYLPFIRPKSLAQDYSSTKDVIKHSINWLEKNEKWYADIIVILQPTTPFRKAKHIDGVIKLLLKSKAQAAMSITTPAYPPHWMVKMNKNFKLKTIIRGGNKYKRRQETPKSFQPAGLVYAMKKDFLYKIKGVLPTGDTRGYYVTSEESLNIDHYSQYLLAKSLSKKYLN
jgi:CMP-N,N'-diacetyllegionaminic acid synthase